MRRNGPARAGMTLVVVLLVSSIAFVCPPSVAQARPAPAATDFYQPPSPLPRADAGTVLRTQESPMALSIPGPDGPIPATATRLMYLSADTHGDPTAVTGTYLQSNQAWHGPGTRPLVAVAVGTQGQGDQCAPSKTLGQLPSYRFPLDLWFNYEIATIYTLLARGMNVVMTDYHGLGTPAVHDYVNRLAEAHAVLDSIRAAETLTGHRVPTLIFGYSQGGGAAAAAAESQQSYAPELDIRGTYAGAPPADLARLLDGPVINGLVPGVIGGASPALLGYALNGIHADYPESRAPIDRLLSPAGKTMLGEVAETCIAEATTRTLFRPATVYTAGGRSVRDALQRSPLLKRLVDQQRIGTLTPQAPVLVAASHNDDVILYPQVRQLAVDWCTRGATVTFADTQWIPPVLPSLAVGHLLEFLPALHFAQRWITDRLAGTPVSNSCPALTQ